MSDITKQTRQKQKTRAFTPEILQKNAKV